LIFRFYIEGCDDVKPLATGCLAERDKTNCLQTLLQFFSRGDHLIEGDVRRWVEVKHEPARDGRMPRLVVPRVKFNGSDLRSGDQTFNTVDLDVGCAIPFHFNERKQVRHAPHFMTLKEALAIDTIGSADD
jgi:hypothetical protein